jgi:hypothetical protein
MSAGEVQAQGCAHAIADAYGLFGQSGDTLPLPAARRCRITDAPQLGIEARAVEKASAYNASQPE